MNMENNNCFGNASLYRTVKFIDILHIIYQKKIAVAVFFSVCVVVVTGIGYYRVNNREIREDNTEEQLQEITSRMDEYDRSIEGFQESGEYFDVQVARIEQYLNDSIYMKIDPLYVKMVTNQYRIEKDDNGETLNRLVFYFNMGSMKSELAERMEIYSEEYVAELISCSTSGSILSVTTMDVDPDRVQRMMDTIDELLREKCGQYGEAELVQLDTVAYEEARADIRNKQYDIYNSYKGYLNTRADNEAKIENLKSAKNAYYESAMEELKTSEKYMHIRTYCLLGVLFAVLCILVYAIFCRSCSDIIQNERDVVALGVPMLGVLKKGKKENSRTEQFALELRSLLKVRGAHRLLLLCDYASTDKVGDLVSCLSGYGVETILVPKLGESPDSFQKAGECDGCIIAVSGEKTPCGEIDHQMQLCRALELPVIGSIYFE